MVNSEKNFPGNKKILRVFGGHALSMLGHFCAISIFPLRLSEIYLQLFRAADKQKELKPYDFSSLLAES